MLSCCLPWLGGENSFTTCARLDVHTQEISYWLTWTTEIWHWTFISCIYSLVFPCQRCPNSLHFWSAAHTAFHWLCWWSWHCDLAPLTWTPTGAHEKWNIDFPEKMWYPASQGQPRKSMLLLSSDWPITSSGSLEAVTSCGWERMGNLTASWMHSSMSRLTSDTDGPKSSVISVFFSPIYPVACFFTAATSTVSWLTNCWDTCCQWQMSHSCFPDIGGISWQLATIITSSDVR